MQKHEEWLWYSKQDMVAAKKLVEDNVSKTVQQTEEAFEFIKDKII